MARKTKAQQTQQQKALPPVEYSDQDIIAMLTLTKGMVTLAAEKLGCAPSTIYRRIKASADVANAITVAREKTLDFAELKLVEQMNKGNVTALIFYLKTQGKARGYIERTEIVQIPSDVKSLMDALGIDDPSQIWAPLKASLQAEKDKREMVQ